MRATSLVRYDHTAPARLLAGARLGAVGARLAPRPLRREAAGVGRCDPFVLRLRRATLRTDGGGRRGGRLGADGSAFVLRLRCATLRTNGGGEALLQRLHEVDDLR